MIHAELLGQTIIVALFRQRKKEKDNKEIKPYSVNYRQE